MSDADLSKWAQTHIYGIDKDAIGIKLTKAVMQIAGDGSAHCVRGDAVRTHQWSKDFPHLNDGSFAAGRFSAIVTNPPFGKNLVVDAKDSRLSSLQIAMQGKGEFFDTEIGIIYLERCYDLLRVGGKLGIILPETYFFSPQYLYLQDWIRSRFKPIVVANVPMEAFQGFCRAKTNFYVFEKIDNEVNEEATVVFLNPKTCGIYKDGGPRFKVDPATGMRTSVVDNELLTHTEMHLSGVAPEGAAEVSLRMVHEKKVLVPTYWDRRYSLDAIKLAEKLGCRLTSIGELLDEGLIVERRGHGSPRNDTRLGCIPYIKVSDIRALRVNINPTNMVPVSVARTLWKDVSSGLQAWDILTPNRASSNIGEFAMLLPGEEVIVLTKEVTIFRATPKGASQGFDQFYLIWALLLKAVRQQWRRIALMQTNREDCGKRYKEILLPSPCDEAWAADVSAPFRDYFTTLAQANDSLYRAIRESNLQFIDSVLPADIHGVDDDILSQ
jgi:type I restriction enzyme M protein